MSPEPAANPGRGRVAPRSTPFRMPAPARAAESG